MLVRFSLSVMFLVNIVVLFFLIALTRADLVNSYPFMWPDSFDWVINGVYYLELVRDGESSLSPTVRQPLFPLLICVSLWLKAPLLLVILGQLAFLTTLYVCYRILRVLEVKDWLISLCILLLSFHYSFNLYRLFLMSDVYAVALLTLSTHLFVCYFQQKSYRLCALGALTAGVGSLFQLYVLLPALIAGGIECLEGLRKKDKSSFVNGFITILLAVLFQILWLVFKELHFGALNAGGVRQFGYLELSSANIEFYPPVLTIAFLPFVLIALFSLPSMRTADMRKLFSRESVFLFLLIMAFTVLFFFYQWKEARFTYYIFGITQVYLFYVLHSLLGEESQQFKARGTKVSFALLAVAVIYVGMVPVGNVQQPKLEYYFSKLSSPKAVLTEGVFGELWTKEPVRRFRDPCLRNSSTREKDVGVRKGCDPYIYENIAHYLDYRKREKDN